MIKSPFPTKIRRKGKTGQNAKKGDISIEIKKGTFLKSFGTLAISA